MSEELGIKIPRSAPSCGLGYCECAEPGGGVCDWCLARFDGTAEPPDPPAYLALRAVRATLQRLGHDPDGVVWRDGSPLDAEGIVGLVLRDKWEGRTW